MSGQPPPYPGYAYPPPPPPGTYPPPPPGPSQRSSSLAIIALVCAVLPCGITWLVAIPLAIVVLVKAANGTARGRGMAVAAIVVSVVWLIASAIGIALLVNEVTKYDAARDAGEGTISSGMIREGDCFSELPDGEEIDTVEIIGCEQEHVGEVYAVESISPAEGAGQDEIYDLAQETCTEQFEDYVGPGPLDPDLRYSLIAPNEDSVDLEDDVACYIWIEGETLTGTLEDSRG